MAEQVYLAVDLGAESGRVMAGIWNGRTLRLEVVHRFPNGPISLADSMRWDVLRLWEEIQNGLARAAKKFGRKIVSVGADGWGLDFVLLDGHSGLLAQPHHYRDARTNGVIEAACRRVPRAEIFSQTGIQFMRINTLIQLLALRRDEPALLAQAERLLLVPDYIHSRLCGSQVTEFTNATTTQCLNPVTRHWAGGLLRKFGLPEKIFGPIVPPGTKLGRLLPGVAQATGLGNIQVIAPPTHDTASAVAGVPARETGRPDWAYLSSGTWSLLGVETRRAVLSKRALELNVTNEGGVDGMTRLLKNIMGLWLVQQLRKSFAARGKKYTYAQLARLAAQAPPARSLVDPDDARFFNPPDMAAAIQEFCRESGQPVPRTEGELVRCAYESLAQKYRTVMEWLEELTGVRIETIHIVGGGSQSAILNQFTATACGRPVVAGPVEATAMGNLLVQIRAQGELKSLAEMREVVRRSVKTVRFEP